MAGVLCCIVLCEFILWRACVDHYINYEGVSHSSYLSLSLSSLSPFSISLTPRLLSFPGVGHACLPTLKKINKPPPQLPALFIRRRCRRRWHDVSDSVGSLETPFKHPLDHPRSRLWGILRFDLLVTVGGYRAVRCDECTPASKATAVIVVWFSPL